MSNAKSTRDHNFFDRAVVFVSAPVQWLVVSSLDGISSVWHRYVALVDVQAENDKLRQENAHLASELVAREEERVENQRLRQVVGLKDKAPEVTMVYGEVIAVAPTPLFRSIRVDKGEADGVRIGSAVVTETGVVGRVAAVSAGYADVMLLVDANSSTDVLVQRTRARARIRGTGRDKHLGLTVEYLARSADVEPGDVMVTSGTSPSFPKGLRVGTVMSVERGAFGLYQRAEVEPAVDFTRIEGVMLLTSAATEATNFEDKPSLPVEFAPVLEDVKPSAPTSNSAPGVVP